MKGTVKGCRVSDDRDKPPGWDRDWYCARVVEKARNGDRAAALEAIEQAIAGLGAGDLSPAIADYLHECLIAATDAIRAETEPGAAFVKAFRLERARGRPVDPRTEDRDFEIALWVYVAVHRYGISLADAKLDAAEVFAVQNIERSIRATGQLDAVSIENAEQFLKDRYIPLPKRH